MKKLFLFAFVFTFCWTGQAEKIKVGVTWSGKSGMANRVLAGIKEVVDKDGAVDLEVVPEMASLDDMKKVVDRFQKEKKAQIVLRSNGAKWLKDNQPTIPTLIGGCNNPKILGVVQNVNKPEGMITGATYFIPYNFSMGIIRKVYPDFKKMTVLAHKGHPTAEINKKFVSGECKKLGLTCTFKVFEDEKGTIDFVKANATKDKTELFLIAATAMVMDITEKVVAAAGEVPVFTFSKGPVKKGAALGFAADDSKLGRAIGENLLKVVKDGKKINELPIVFDKSPTIFANKASLEKYKIKLPKAIAGRAEFL